MVIKKHMNKQSFEGVESDVTGSLLLFPPLELFLRRSGQESSNKAEAKIGPILPPNQILTGSQPPKAAALQIPKSTCQRQGWFRQHPSDSLPATCTGLVTY